jgi:hypothetical protein
MRDGVQPGQGTCLTQGSRRRQGFHLRSRYGGLVGGPAGGQASGEQIGEQVNPACMEPFWRAASPVCPVRPRGAESSLPTGSLFTTVFYSQHPEIRIRGKHMNIQGLKFSYRNTMHNCTFAPASPMTSPDPACSQVLLTFAFDSPTFGTLQQALKGRAFWPARAAAKSESGVPAAAEKYGQHRGHPWF